MASTVKGLAKLNAQLKALPEAVRRAAAEQLKSNADDLADAISRAAPRRTGALAESVGTTVGEPPAGALGASGYKASALGGVGLSVTVHAGDEKAFYAGWVENGTSASPEGTFKDSNGKTRSNSQPHHPTPAQPFFWPTVRAWKAPMKSKMSRAGSKAAKAAAAARGGS